MAKNSKKFLGDLNEKKDESVTLSKLRESQEGEGMVLDISLENLGFVNEPGREWVLSGSVQTEFAKQFLQEVFLLRHESQKTLRGDINWF